MPETDRKVIPFPRRDATPVGPLPESQPPGELVRIETPLIKSIWDKAVRRVPYEGQFVLSHEGKSIYITNNSFGLRTARIDRVSSQVTEFWLKPNQIEQVISTYSPGAISRALQDEAALKQLLSGRFMRPTEPAARLLLDSSQLNTLRSLHTIIAKGAPSPIQAPQTSIS